MAINTAPETSVNREFEIIRLTVVSGAVKPDSIHQSITLLVLRARTGTSRPVAIGHVACNTSDAAEGGGTEIYSRLGPVRVIEGVECLKADRQSMLFVVRHQKILV